MALQDIQPPESYTIAFDGQGGAAGFGKGVARVSLAPDGDETLLTYAVTAQVGGKIAQIGSRLIDAAARKMADTFFVRFTEVVSGSDAEADTEAANTDNDASGQADGASTAGEQQEGKRKRSWTAWISKP